MYFSANHLPTLVQAFVALNRRGDAGLQGEDHETNQGAKSVIKQTLFAFLLAFGATGATAIAGDADKGGVSEQNGVRAINAWTRATSDKTALVFVEIENTSDKGVTLKGGKSPVAGSVELVGFQLEGGEPTYSTFPDFPIEPGLKVALAPKGMALRLNDVSKPLEKGQAFEMQIDFDHGPLKVNVSVEEAGANTPNTSG